MIDRNARDELISAVDDFLDDKIMSMELGDRLADIKSEDPVVNHSIQAMISLNVQGTLLNCTLYICFFFAVGTMFHLRVAVTRFGVVSPTSCGNQYDFDRANAVYPSQICRPQ